MIYKKIDATKTHKKLTNMKSMKLATILNKMFYYLEYADVLSKQEDIENFNYYKYNIIISIGRNVMELFNIYEYFGEYGISKEEYALRQLCADYHETLSIEKIDQGLKNYDALKFNQFTMYFPSCNYQDWIPCNKVYQNSDEKWQKAFLKARKCYYFARVSKKINLLPHALESILYNIFSNYIHSFEMTLGYDITRGNQYMYAGYYQAILSIQVMILYSATVLKDYIARRNMKALLTKEESKYLQSLLTYANIEKTLVQWKNKFDMNRIYEDLLEPDTEDVSS